MVTVKNTQTITFTSTAPSNAVYNGPTYNVTASATSGLAVTFGTSTPGVCTVSGSTVSFVGVGTCTVTANQAGNANYAAAAQATQTFPVGQASQTITFTSTAPSNAVYNGSYTVAATASSALAVTFGSSTPTVCTVSASTVSFVGVGTCTVAANQAGNANYLAAAQATQTFTVGQASQTISFTSTAPSNPVYFGPTYTVSATGGASGNPVTFGSSTPAVCSPSGSIVSFGGVGTCTVTANQAGNANYAAAPQATQSFTVAKADQTISFGALAGETFGDSPLTLSATATSGLTVSFSSQSSGKCTVSGTTVTINHAGDCTVQASQAGNANYNPAPNVQQTFTIAQASQTINFTSGPPSPVYGDPSYTVTATGGGSGNAVMFGTSTPSVCTSTGQNGSTVRFVGAGTCIVTADQGGTADYLAAPQVIQTIVVGRKLAAVTPNAANKTYGGTDPALTGRLTGFLGRTT